MIEKKNIQGLPVDIVTGDDKDKVVHKIWTDYIAQAMERDYLSLYINVPFCTRKCTYCEYPSKIKSGQIDNSYLDALEKRLIETARVLDGHPVPVIMFGGGSPSILTPKQLDRVLTMIETNFNLQFDDNKEKGFEFHPYQLTDEHIRVLRGSYINRLSMGLQSFDEDVLKAENRIHTTVDRVHEIYYYTHPFTKQFNVDLLAGLHKQTADTLVKDVYSLLNIGVESVTIYELNEIPTHKADKEMITKMLEEVYKAFRDNPVNRYTYIGTTLERFEHCNKFYKDGIGFAQDYNPAPQGHNNIISFSLDDDASFRQHVWSHFHPLNLAYEYRGDRLLVYKMTDIAEVDRPWWKNAFEIRDMWKKHTN